MYCTSYYRAVCILILPCTNCAGKHSKVPLLLLPSPLLTLLTVTSFGWRDVPMRCTNHVLIVLCKQSPLGNGQLGYHWLPSPVMTNVMITHYQWWLMGWLPEHPCDLHSWPPSHTVLHAAWQTCNGQITPPCQHERRCSLQQCFVHMHTNLFFDASRRPQVSFPCNLRTLGTFRKQGL